MSYSAFKAANLLLNPKNGCYFIKFRKEPWKKSTKLSKDLTSNTQVDDARAAPTETAIRDALSILNASQTRRVGGIDGPLFLLAAGLVAKRLTRCGRRPRARLDGRSAELTAELTSKSNQAASHVAEEQPKPKQLVLSVRPSSVAHYPIGHVNHSTASISLSSVWR